jgi:NADPH2:quinone reductase
MLMSLALLATTIALAHGSLAPSTMRSVRTTGIGGCKAPFESCVKLKTVRTPTPKAGNALIRVNATSVNPSDVDEVEGGACMFGCGADVSGTVVACPGCTRLKVGDEVWTLARGAYADFVVSPESSTGVKPASISHADAGTVPEVGLTSLFSLKRTASDPSAPLPPPGSPWGAKTNLSVVITAGSGGTGAVGIQFAKAWGAAHIATATTGEAGIEFVKSLGATFVTDYKKIDLFDALASDSVDIVYDNYGAEGTADKAMRVLRAGGTYLLMPHGECYVSKSQKPPCLSAHPKAGVRQLNYDTSPDFEKNALPGLDEMAGLVARGALRATVGKSFELADAARAFNFSAGRGEGGVSQHVGKISMVVAA